MSDASQTSSRERLGRLLKNTSIYAFGDAGVKLLLALLAPLLTFILTPAAFGVWSLTMTFMAGFTNFCNPALHGSVTRFYFDQRELAAQKRFQGTVLSFLLLWSFGLCVLATLTGRWLFAAVFENLPFWPYGLFAIWMTFISVLGVVPKAIWQAAERSKPIVVLSLLENSIFVFGSMALLTFTSAGLVGLFLGRTSSLLVVAVPLLIYSVREVGLAWSWADLRSILRFSLPLVPHLLAHWVLNMGDRIIIEHYYSQIEAGTLPDGDFGTSSSERLGLQAVGIYDVACVFIGVVSMISAAMNKAWVPQFYRSHDRPEQRLYIARSITWFVLSVAAMSVASIVLSPTIVRGLIGPEYAFAARIAPILAFGGLFQGLYYVYVAVLFHHKQTRLVPVITVISGIVNIALNLLWLPKYGLAGAAWATVLGYTMLAVGMRWASRNLPMPMFETGQLLRIGAVLSTVTIAGLLVDGHLPLIGEALVKLIVLGLGAAALWWLRIFDSHEPAVETA